MNALTEFMFEVKVPHVDVPLLCPGPEFISPDTVMIALYPSGATRTVGTVHKIKDGKARLAFFRAWDLLDPNDEGDLQLGQNFTGNLLVMGIFIGE